MRKLSVAALACLALGLLAASACGSAAAPAPSATAMVDPVVGDWVSADAGPKTFLSVDPPRTGLYLVTWTDASSSADAVEYFTVARKGPGVYAEVSSAYMPGHRTLTMVGSSVLRFSGSDAWGYPCNQTFTRQR